MRFNFKYIALILLATFPVALWFLPSFSSYGRSVFQIMSIAVSPLCLIIALFILLSSDSRGSNSSNVVTGITAAKKKSNTGSYIALGLFLFAFVFTFVLSKFFPQADPNLMFVSLGIFVLGVIVFFVSLVSKKSDSLGKVAVKTGLAIVALIITILVAGALFFVALI